MSSWLSYHNIREILLLLSLSFRYIDMCIFSYALNTIVTPSGGISWQTKNSHKSETILKEFEGEGHEVNIRKLTFLTFAKKKKERRETINVHYAIFKNGSHVLSSYNLEGFEELNHFQSCVIHKSILTSLLPHV